MEKLTRRSLLLSLSTAVIAVPALAAGYPEDRPFHVPGTLAFIGVYTDQGSKSLGIYSYRWDAAKGELSPIGLAAATPNPSFLAVSPDRRLLYAANEVVTFRSASDGSVSSFAIDRQTGQLAIKSVVSSVGSGPCNINTDHSGKCVFVANYNGGSCASFQAEPGGLLSEAVSHFHYSGHGPRPKRQETAHVHCVTASPGNGYLLVNDLGLDKIYVYKLNPTTAALTAHDPAAYNALPGSGPRSFVFHPNGRYAYTTNELSNTVDVLDWSETHGTLTRIQNLDSLAPGTKYSAGVTAASVVVDREGHFVYVSNRGEEHDSLSVFAVDPASGRLTFVQNIASGGKTPRHFALDPSGKWIVVAHQGSHTLVVFARDTASGKLTATGRSYPVDWPTCVLFV